MRNLYVFAIGGSGERVFHSFLMLAAAGMTLDIQGSVYPIFIDTDANAKSLERVKTLLHEYRSIRDKVYDSNYAMNGSQSREGIYQRLFSINVEKEKEFVIPGTSLNTLQALIESEGNLSDDAKAELQLLYSDELLDMPLEFGFVGVPSIGSIALNYILEQHGVSTLLQGMQKDDGMFVIGSINGGTGAAGLPLLLNKFKLEQGNALPDFYCGALSMLPYFKFDDSQRILPPQRMNQYFSMLDATTFDAKTKAALEYYDKHMKGLSSLYFLGVPDNHRTKVTKAIGGIDQNQQADYIEVIAARSIIHFTRTAQHISNKDANPQFYQYALQTGTYKNPATESYNLLDIPDSDIARSLVRGELFYYIVNSKLSSFLSNSTINYGKNLGVINGNLNCYNEYRTLLEKFLDKWKEWRDGISAKSHGINMDYVQTNIDRSSEVEVLAKFNPSRAQTHREGIPPFRHEVITDPGFLNLMVSTVPNSVGPDLKVMTYSISYAIEKVLNDARKSKLL